MFLRDWQLEKLWGKWGIFEPQEFFFVIKFRVWIFFRPQHEYFLGLIGVHEFFFHLIFPCANIFFVLRPSPHPPPPHKFSNGPSLMPIPLIAFQCVFSPNTTRLSSFGKWSDCKILNNLRLVAVYSVHKDVKWNTHILSILEIIHD